MRLVQQIRLIQLNKWSKLTYRRNSLKYSTNAFSAEELSHFNALAGTWWDANGSSRLLHKMNPVRVDFMFDTINLYNIPQLSKLQDLSVLDVGCGGGILTESLARHPRIGHVKGIDMSDQVLEIARAHQKQDPKLTANKLEYSLCSLFDIPTPVDDEDKFDAVTMFEVLEHVPNPSAMLEKATSLVKPGGWIFASTVNRTVAAYLSTIFIGEDILQIVPKKTHTWAKYINEAELRQWFLENKSSGIQQWDVVKSQGCVYVPFVGWVLAGPRDLGNYFLAARRAV
ncbi:S-adenosyl-L-methionine-dependent methyltransferase [Lipomyces oligophaga]|uniref:S-adenosyl-L-methionine-dependent methyltransferase n=1 Tax=Lipomyces oligophaga TaxID=45792 RepID=UPI0034CEC486